MAADLAFSDNARADGSGSSGATYEHSARSGGAAAPPFAAPPDWSLKQIVWFWTSDQEELPDQEELKDFEYLMKCRLFESRLAKLTAMGLTTRSQACDALTDELCQTLDTEFCDDRRRLLDLLGIDWRQRVWSEGEQAVWKLLPTMPTEHGDEGPWREEIQEFRNMMGDLGLSMYSHYFHEDEYGLLGIATARNFLCYLCNSDLAQFDIPVFVRRALRAEALTRVTGSASTTRANVCFCKEFCKCVGDVRVCMYGARHQLPSGQWYICAIPESTAKPPPNAQAGNGKTDLEAFKDNVRKLRVWLARNENQYPKQHSGHSMTERLACFVKLQRARHKQGKLEPARIELLKALPSWSFGGRTEKWQELYDAAKDSLQKQAAELHEDQVVHYPGKSSHKACERQLGQWLWNQRAQLRSREHFSQERRLMLEALPGWAAFVNKRAPGDEARKAATSKRSHPQLAPAVSIGVRLRQKTSPAELSRTPAESQKSKES